MAARTQREAQRLSSFCNFAVFFLLISGLFALNSFALTSYTWQELLDIGLHFSNSFITNPRLIPEISRTPEATHSTRPGGSVRRWRRDRKQRRGKCGGLRAKLKLTPHRLSLPSIFLANVQSWWTKWMRYDLQSKSLLLWDVMVFMEHGYNSNIPNNVIDLTGRYTLRADRTADDSGRPEAEDCAFM